MTKKIFLIEAQVYYYTNMRGDDVTFNLLDDEAKNIVIKDIIENDDSLSNTEFKFMVEKTNLFGKYLDGPIYENGNDITIEQFNMLSNSQKIEYYNILWKVAEEEEELDTDYWIKHPINIWYKAYIREQQIKTVIDD